MIHLVSAPTAPAIARLQGCVRRAHEAEEAGEQVPVAVRDCYRHAEVKASIVAETAGKCAYCESKITHVYWGDVEHIMPKHHFPDRSLEYNNLTMACAICNNKKGDYYNEDAPILNPYHDMPEDHLVAIGSLLWHRNGSPTGQRSITLFDLNRDGLTERRLERLDRLSALVDRYINEPDGPIKRVLGAQILDEAAESAEFALAARSFLHHTHNLQWNAI